MPHKVNILLVDDTPENLYSLERTLKDPDLNLINASSGNEALARVLDTDFACILLDVQMPDMDGFEVARLLRGDEQTCHIPIIFVTAHHLGKEDVFRGYSTGAVDYLLKPLDPDIVRSKVSVFADLYRQKKELERANRKLQALNNELERFAFLASHDLKEPLRMVSTQCQLLVRKCGPKLSKDELTCVHYAVEGSRRMGELIEDVLAYTKLRRQSSRAERVSTSEVLSEVVTTLKDRIEESGARIEYDELPVLEANPSHLHQLFQNLIANAIKYRREETSPRIRVTAEHGDGDWTFAVSDNGIGIAPEYHERVFGLFERLHTKDNYPGTGLGLAICKKIIERYEGKIWVKSQPGEGSTFYFRIPEEHRSAADEPESPEA